MGLLTRIEKQTPSAKQIMKPLIRVDQLSDVASEIWLEYFENIKLILMFQKIKPQEY